MAVLCCTVYMYLITSGAWLALSPWETWEASEAPFSLRTPNACCSLNTLREKTETFLSHTVREILV